MYAVTYSARLRHPHNLTDMYKYAREKMADEDTRENIHPGCFCEWNSDPFLRSTPFGKVNEGKLTLKDYDDIHEIARWININISTKIDINTEATDRVLLRIAAGMINKLDVSKDSKIEAHNNLIRNWAEARREWNVFANIQESLPF